MSVQATPPLPSGVSLYKSLRKERSGSIPHTANSQASQGGQGARLKSEISQFDSEGWD